ncbi:hypothetical protein AAY473_016055 [Plecturocebus cupreus]
MFSSKNIGAYAPTEFLSITRLECSDMIAAHCNLHLLDSSKKAAIAPHIISDLNQVQRFQDMYRTCRGQCACSPRASANLAPAQCTGHPCVDHKSYDGRQSDDESACLSSGERSVAGGQGPSSQGQRSNSTMEPTLWDEVPNWMENFLINFYFRSMVIPSYKEDLETIMCASQSWKLSDSETQNNSDPTYSVLSTNALMTLERESPFKPTASLFISMTKYLLRYQTLSLTHRNPRKA